MSDTTAPVAAGSLPDPQRIITTTNAEGKSTFSSAHPASLPSVRDLGGALFRLAYVAPAPLAELTGDADVNTYSDHLNNLPQLVVPGGPSIVWYIDTPPLGESPMHRTVSLDIVVLIEGEAELTLESGEPRTLRVGDVVVQRGTTHAWRNPSSTKWTRMLAVMTESKPVEVNGEKLLTYFPEA